jgi:hypothetical protein
VGDSGPALPASTPIPLSQIDQPGTPNPATTIISGGTSLGNGSPNNVHTTAAVVTPSKSDAASSWRRGGNNNSVLTPNRAVSSVPGSGNAHHPHLPSKRPPNAHLGVKFRPQPLRFNAAVSQPLPTVTIDTTDYETDDSFPADHLLNPSSLLLRLLIPHLPTKCLSRRARRRPRSSLKDLG